MLVARRLLPLFALPALFIGSACSQGEVTAIPLAPRDWAASDYKLEATASADAVQAGDAVTFRATVTAPTGEDISEAVDFSTELSPSLGVLSDGDGQYRFANADTYTWFVSVDIMGTTLVDAVSVAVSPGPAATVDLRLSVPMVEAGIPVAFTATVFDAWGNELEGADEALVHSATPSANISGDLITATLAGAYTMTSTLADGTASDSEQLTVMPSSPASLDITLSSYDVERGQGVVVETVVLDNFGNEVDYPVDVSTVPSSGTESWANFVRFHEEGEYAVHADITDYALHAEDGPVLVDSSGPLVRVIYPPRGAELDRVDGQVIPVTGIVTDALSGVSSFAINGDVVAVDSATGSFSYDMSAVFGLNTIEIVSVDGDDNNSDVFQTFLWGDYTPQGQSNEDAILARLNDGAIDAIEDMLVGMITGGVIEQELLGSALGSYGGAPLTVTSVSVGNPAIDLDTFSDNPEGYLEVYASFAPLSLGVSLNSAVIGSESVAGIDGTLYMNASFSGGVDEIQALSHVRLSVDSNNIIQAELIPGSTQVNVVGLWGGIDGFNTWVSVDGCPWWLGWACSAVESVLNAVLGGISAILNVLGDLILGLLTSLFNLLNPIFEGLITDLLEDELGPIIEDALAGLEIVTDIDLINVVISLDALPQDIEVDDDGMLIALESIITAPLSPAAPVTLGALYDIDSQWPVYSLAEDIHLSMEDGFVNQLLHSAWQGGVLDMTMDAASLGLDLDQVSSVLPLSQLDLAMQPLLPPIVGPKPGGGMELSIGDLLINVNGDPGGVSGLMMQIAVTVVADADFTLDSEGNIVFDFTDPVLYMDFVTANPWTVNGETVENVMEAVIDILIPTLIDTLGGLGGFEMPELGGFAINGSSFEREPAPAAYLTMSGEISVQ